MVINLVLTVAYLLLGRLRASRLVITIVIRLFMVGLLMLGIGCCGWFLRLVV